MLSQQPIKCACIAVMFWAATLTVRPAVAADLVGEARTPLVSEVRDLKDWRGLSTDLGVYRPLNSRVVISPNNTGPDERANLTGIHLAVTAAYLFQEGYFVIGPRINASGGWIETMSTEFTVRTNALLTFGGEAGIAIWRLYGYAFGVGGAAWLSAERIGVQRANNVVPVHEFGAGFRYALSQRAYWKSEFSATILGDQRLGFDHFEPKPYVSFTAGFGFQFTSN